MGNLDLNIELSQKQVYARRTILQFAKRILGFGGAKGGGKSHFGRELLIEMCVVCAGIKALIVRKTFPELERTHIREIKKKYIVDWEKSGKPSICKEDKQRHAFEFFNGSILECAYCEREEDAESLFSAEYDIIFVDESQFHKKRVIQVLRTCNRSKKEMIARWEVVLGKKFVPFMLLTFNWGGIGHAWLKKIFWRKWMKVSPSNDAQLDTWDNPEHWEAGENPNDYAFIQSRIYDNPFVDDTYKNILDALPEQLKMSYKEGDPDFLEGQFFPEFGSHMREDPFDIEESELYNNLYGAIDHGLVHDTSFGLYWLAPNADHWNKRFGVVNSIHRLLSYDISGYNADENAAEIFNKIQHFPWIKGVFPKTIWYPPDMDKRSGVNDVSTATAIDEYIRRFGKRSSFELCNNDRVFGCQIMRRFFKAVNGTTQFRYWAGYNTTLEDGIISLITDKNNREVYLKTDGDDEGDQTRYGLSGIWSIIGNLKNENRYDKKVKEHNQKIASTNWKDL